VDHSGPGEKVDPSGPGERVERRAQPGRSHIVAQCPVLSYRRVSAPLPPSCISHVISRFTPPHVPFPLKLLRLPALLLTCGAYAEDEPAESAAVFALLCARLSEPVTVRLPHGLSHSLSSGPLFSFPAAIVQAQWAALLASPLLQAVVGSSFPTAALPVPYRAPATHTYSRHVRRSQVRLDPLCISASAGTVAGSGAKDGPGATATSSSPSASLAALAARLRVPPLLPTQASATCMAALTAGRVSGTLLLAGTGALSSSSSGAAGSSSGAAVAAASASVPVLASDVTLPLTASTLCVAVDAMLQVGVHALVWLRFRSNSNSALDSAIIAMLSFANHSQWTVPALHEHLRRTGVPTAAFIPSLVSRGPLAPFAAPHASAVRWSLLLQLTEGWVGWLCVVSSVLAVVADDVCAARGFEGVLSAIKRPSRITAATAAVLSGAAASHGISSEKAGAALLVGTVALRVDASVLPGSGIVVAPAAREGQVPRDTTSAADVYAYAVCTASAQSHAAAAVTAGSLIPTSPGARRGSGTGSALVTPAGVRRGSGAGSAGWVTAATATSFAPSTADATQIQVLGRNQGDLSEPIYCVRNHTHTPNSCTLQCGPSSRTSRTLSQLIVGPLFAGGGSGNLPVGLAAKAPAAAPNSSALTVAHVWAAPEPSPLLLPSLPASSLVYEAAAAHNAAVDAVDVHPPPRRDPSPAALLRGASPAHALGPSLSPARGDVKGSGSLVPLAEESEGDDEREEGYVLSGEDGDDEGPSSGSKLSRPRRRAAPLSTSVDTGSREGTPIASDSVALSQLSSVAQQQQPLAINLLDVLREQELAVMRAAAEAAAVARAASAPPPLKPYAGLDGAARMHAHQYRMPDATESTVVEAPSLASSRPLPSLKSSLSSVVARVDAGAREPSSNAAARGSRVTASENQDASLVYTPPPPKPVLSGSVVDTTPAVLSNQPVSPSSSPERRQLQAGPPYAPTTPLSPRVSTVLLRKFTPVPAHTFLVCLTYSSSVPFLCSFAEVRAFVPPESNVRSSDADEQLAAVSDEARSVLRIHDLGIGGCELPSQPLQPQQRRLTTSPASPSRKFAPAYQRYSPQHSAAAVAPRSPWPRAPVPPPPPPPPASIASPSASLQPDAPLVTTEEGPVMRRTSINAAMAVAAAADLEVARVSAAMAAIRYRALIGPSAALLALETSLPEPVPSVLPLPPTGPAAAVESVLAALQGTDSGHEGAKPLEGTAEGKAPTSTSDTTTDAALSKRVAADRAFVAAIDAIYPDLSHAPSAGLDSETPASAFPTPAAISSPSRPPPPPMSRALSPAKTTAAAAFVVPGPRDLRNRAAGDAQQTTSPSAAAAPSSEQREQAETAVLRSPRSAPLPGGQLWLLPSFFLPEEESLAAHPSPPQPTSESSSSSIAAASESAGPRAAMLSRAPLDVQPMIAAAVATARDLMVVSPPIAAAHAAAAVDDALAMLPPVLASAAADAYVGEGAPAPALPLTARKIPSPFYPASSLPLRSHAADGLPAGAEGPAAPVNKQTTSALSGSTPAVAIPALSFGKGPGSPEHRLLERVTAAAAATVTSPRSQLGHLVADPSTPRPNEASAPFSPAAAGLRGKPTPPPASSAAPPVWMRPSPSAATTQPQSPLYSPAPLAGSQTQSPVAGAGGAASYSTPRTAAKMSDVTAAVSGLDTLFASGSRLGSAAASAVDASARAEPASPAAEAVSKLDPLFGSGSRFGSSTSSSPVQPTPDGQPQKAPSRPEELPRPLGKSPTVSPPPPVGTTWAAASSTAPSPSRARQPSAGSQQTVLYRQAFAAPGSQGAATGSNPAVPFPSTSASLQAGRFDAASDATSGGRSAEGANALLLSHGPGISSRLLAAALPALSEPDY
jgi:hypothetical protein